MKKGLLISIVLAGIMALALLIYAFSPLLYNREVNEISPMTEDSLAENAVIYDGDFIGEGGHAVEGKSLVILEESGRILRLEDFKSTNGPDLKVYLAEDIDANSYVSLGDLKGNIGNQNYDIPEEVDLEKYSRVLIWCEQFHVLFGYSELNPT